MASRQMKKETCEHKQIEVKSVCTECGQELGNAQFSRAEIEATQQSQELPNREAMSLVNANIAAPINAALALNVLSDGSIAVANATQYAPITQAT